MIGTNLAGVNEDWAVINCTSSRLSERTPYTLQLVTDPSQSPGGKAARQPRGTGAILKTLSSSRSALS